MERKMKERQSVVSIKTYEIENVEVVVGSQIFLSVELEPTSQLSFLGATPHHRWLFMYIIFEVTLENSGSRPISYADCQRLNNRNSRTRSKFKVTVRLTRLAN
jgi:hypothetical protein